MDGERKEGGKETGRDGGDRIGGRKAEGRGQG